MSIIFLYLAVRKLILKLKIMKKILLILLFFPLLFTTCKKEETDDNTSFSLIGNWNWVSVTSNGSEGYYTDYPNGKVTTNSESITSIPGDTLLELTSWNMEVKDNGTLINNYTSSTIIIHGPDTAFWQRIGDNLIIGGQHHTITTLTNSSLIYIFRFIETETYNDTLWFEETEAIYSFNRE